MEKTNTEGGIRQTAKGTSMITKTVVAMERDGLDVRTFVLNFHVSSESFDIVAAAKAAAKEYCLTEEGKRIYEGNCNCFNWGDFDAYVPQDICRRHGFAKIESPIPDELVDFDEQLVDECDIFPVE